MACPEGGRETSTFHFMMTLLYFARADKDQLAKDCLAVGLADLI